MHTPNLAGLNRRHDLGATVIGTLLALLKLGVVDCATQPTLYASIVRLVAEWDSTFETTAAERRAVELRQVELRG
jgi:hypothetical protein